MKEKTEHSLLFVGIYACLLAWLGGLLGFICLMQFPLQAFPDMQAQAKTLEGREPAYIFPGDAFYLEGPVARAPGWTTKRQQLLDASAASLQISVGDINAWIDAKFRSAAVPASEQQGLMLMPERPNVGIAADVTTYLNFPAKISGYGLEGKYVLSARIHYREGTPARLVVDHLQIAGAAVPLPRMIGARIVSTLINSFSSADEYALIQEAWSRVQAVETSDGACVLTLNLR